MKLLITRSIRLRQVIAAILCSLSIAIIITLCDSINAEGYFSFSNLTIIQFLTITLIATCIFLCLYLLFKEKATSNIITEVAISKFTIFKYTAFIFILWTPWIIALYPANFLGDTLISIGWFTQTLNGAEGILSDHNPILTVILFGAIALFGKTIGHADIVFFAYVVLQAALCAFAFSLAIHHAVCKLHLNIYAARFTLVFYALCPLFPIWSTFISKDTLFAPLFVIWLVFYIETIRTSGLLFTNAKRVIQFTLLTIFACLTKKLGVYILLPSICILLLWLLFLYTKKKKTTLHRAIRNGFFGFIFSTVVLLLIFPHVILPACDIKPTERYEMLSVPLQQTARYVHDHGDDVTPEERAAIDNLLDYSDLAERWQWYLADPVKYRIQEPTDAYREWLHVYIAQGLRHPLSYLQSYVALESGFGKSAEKIAVQLDSSFMTDYDASNIPDAYTSRGWSVTTGRIAQSIYNWLSSLPIIETFFLCVPYTVIIPFFLIFATFCGTKKIRTSMLLLIIPILLTEAGLWISPISIWVLGSRYALPLIFTAPILLIYSVAAIKGTIIRPVRHSAYDDSSDIN